MQHLEPPTPLSGRKYLRGKDLPVAPSVFSATQSVIKLKALLAGCQTTPTATLMEIFASCNENVEKLIENKVQEIGEQFCSSYTAQTGEENQALSVDFGKRRLTLAQTLFYKVLEAILKEEQRKKPNADLTVSLSLCLFN